MQNPQDKFVQVGNINTRYWDLGQSGIPIVLVHGIIASVEYWEKNIFELAKSHRVIAVDLIGFGKTDKPDIDYTLDAFVQFLNSFLKTLEIEQCFLVGHSLGGGICLKFALDFPETVKKLILISSVGLSHQLPLGIRLFSLSYLNKIIYHVSQETIMRAIRKHVYDQNKLDDVFLKRLVTLAQTTSSKRTLMSLLRTNVDLRGIRKKIIAPLIKRFTKFKIPVLIIWGKQDKLLPLKNVHQTIKLIPFVTCHVFDQCGHMPQIEHANASNQLIKDFLINKGREK
jgi:pimeloyl-ACP methyl ester carboxylesterase